MALMIVGVVGRQEVYVYTTLCITKTYGVSAVQAPTRRFATAGAVLSEPAFFARKLAWAARKLLQSQ
jgi:hypothetical protein